MDGTGMLVAGSNVVFNMEPLVDLKVQTNVFSMSWVLSGVPDTVTVGFHTASYPSLSCAGNYLKLSRDQRGVPSVPILYFPHFISGRQLIFYSCFAQTKLQLSHRTIKTSMKLALVLPFKLKVGRV